MKPSPIRPLASLGRILLLSVVFGSVVGLFMLRGLLDRERQLLGEIDRLEDAMAAELAVRDAMIDRLGRTRRLARIHILSQELDLTGQIQATQLRFVELDDDGAELARQDYELPGDVLFVDAWTVRFDHEQVATGDPFAGQSLVLFRRIYSDRMPPREGIPIDTPGGIPEGYAVTDQARFERAMWTRFWRLATDAEEARQMGVRVAQGEAVYKPVRTGQLFDLVAESAGGLTLIPVDPDESGARFATASPED